MISRRFVLNLAAIALPALATATTPRAVLAQGALFAPLKGAMTTKEVQEYAWWKARDGPFGMSLEPHEEYYGFFTRWDIVIGKVTGLCSIWYRSPRFQGDKKNARTRAGFDSVITTLSATYGPPQTSVDSVVVPGTEESIQGVDRMIIRRWQIENDPSKLKGIVARAEMKGADVSQVNVRFAYDTMPACIKESEDYFARFQD